MTPRQRRSINRVIRFYRSRASLYGNTSVRLKLDQTAYGSIWVAIETRRDDCSKHSALAVMTHKWGHIRIGKRGGIEVWSAYTRSTEDEAKHVAHCLRGRVKRISRAGIGTPA